MNLESSLSSWTGIDNYTQLWNIFKEWNFTVSTEPVKWLFTVYGIWSHLFLLDWNWRIHQPGMFSWSGIDDYRTWKYTPGMELDGFWNYTTELLSSQTGFELWDWNWRDSNGTCKNFPSQEYGTEPGIFSFTTSTGIDEYKMWNCFFSVAWNWWLQNLAYSWHGIEECWTWNMLLAWNWQILTEPEYNILTLGMELLNIYGTRNIL